LPRQLGRWPAARTGLPFEDLATDEERAKAAAAQAALLAEQMRHLREMWSDWVRALPGFGRRK
jgi:hypothetical protein